MVGSLPLEDCKKSSINSLFAILLLPGSQSLPHQYSGMYWLLLAEGKDINVMFLIAIICPLCLANDIDILLMQNL